MAAGSVKTLVSGKTLTLVVTGDFKFDLYHEFRDAFSKTEKGIQLIIDLRHVTSMDSSAMGMLLNMKETLDRGDREIHLRSAPPHLLKLLQISRFDKKFIID
jgi:anti-anti-sigma factor